MGSQRGLVARIERRLEATVDNAFAQVFGGSIVPQEVEALLRREAEAGVRALGGNRLLVPNEYIITLGMQDFEKVVTGSDPTSGAFARYLADYIYEQVMKEIGPNVWDARIHTKNKKVYDDKREQAIEAGYKVSIANRITDARFENINYNYYILKAQELVSAVNG